ncbi:unnamed protein product [Pedinophyceae sp. YPF-701]|nr:unnamed protein product [Pedinophyceae sp. YPF-701]
MNTIDWRDQWWPVQLEENLDADKPNAVVCLGEAIVLWKDGAAWRAFADRCPHRAVPLSEGRINEAGRIECPYHGWDFDGAGKCHHVPQAPERTHASAAGSPRACAVRFPVAVRQGLVFVHMKPLPPNTPPGESEPDPADIPLLDDVDTDAGWVMDTVVRDMPMSAATVFENVLDVSHVPHTHHGTVGRRERSTPVELEVTARRRDGFDGVWAQGPRNGIYGPQTTVFRGPQLMVHSLDCVDTKGFATKTVVYATPTTPGRCRLIARFPFYFKPAVPRTVFRLTPKWWSHRGANRVLEDDQIFLHKQERTVLAERLEAASLSKIYYMPTTADAFVTAFRDWLDNVAGGGPFGPPSKDLLAAMPPAQSRTELLDRYGSHTAHCKACSGAKRNMEVAIKACRVASLACLAAAAALAAIASVGGAAIDGVSGSDGLAARALAAAAGLLAPAGTTPVEAMGRAVGAGGAAVALELLRAAVRKLWMSMVNGEPDYPPPRNRVK